MNERQRVIDALHMREGFIPYQVDTVGSTYTALQNHYGDENFLYACIGNHLVREKNKNHRYIDDCRYVDIFGVPWRVDAGSGGDIGVIEKYILKEISLDSYNLPKPDADLIGSKCADLVQNHPTRFMIFELSHALFERAWMLRGMEELLTDFLTDEAFVYVLFDRLLQYNLAAIDIAARYKIDCIMFGDDWGQQSGLIMGPSLWRKFIKPVMSKLFDRVKKYGLYTCLHSCGDNYEIFGELIDMGLDMYNTFQTEIYDVDKFKREYGRDLTIYGGLSAQTVLAQGTKYDVERETKRLAEKLGKGGGLILAPSHQITPDVPLENILAFVNTIKTQEAWR